MTDKLFPIAKLDDPKQVRVMLYSGHDAFAHVPLQEILKFVSAGGVSGGGGTIMVADAGLCDSEQMVTFKIPAGGAGDMKTSRYDPRCIKGDVFDMKNMTESEEHLILKPDERADIAKVSGLVSDMETAQGDIVKVTDRVTTAEGKIVALENKDIELKGIIDANQKDIESKVEKNKETIERTVSENKKDIESKLNEAKTTLNREIAKNKSETDEKIAKNKSDTDREIAKNKGEADKEIAGLKAKDEEIARVLEESKSELKGHVDVTKAELAQDLADLKSSVETDLSAAKTDLSQSISTLDQKVDKNQRDITNNLSEVNRELTTKLDTTKGELTNNLNDVNTRLTNRLDETKRALEENLATAKTDLDSKIDKTKEELTNNLTQVNTNLTTQLKNTKTELTTKLDETKTELTNTINTHRSEINDKNKDQDDEINALKVKDLALQNGIDEVQRCCTNNANTISEHKSDFNKEVNNIQERINKAKNEARESLQKARDELQKAVEAAQKCCDDNAQAARDRDAEHDKEIEALKKDVKHLDGVVENLSNTAVENEDAIRHLRDDSDSHEARIGLHAGRLTTVEEVAGRADAKSIANKEEIDVIHDRFKNMPTASHEDQADYAPFLLQKDANNLVCKKGTTIYIELGEDVIKKFSTDQDMTINVGKSLVGIKRVDAGKDYYVYLTYDTATDKFRIVISDNSTFPAGFDANNSRKIGGFHTLCADVGTIDGHPLSKYRAKSILPASVWCLNHRPRSNAEGMVYDHNVGVWVDIYLQSGTGATASSRFGLPITTNIEYLDHLDPLLDQQKQPLDDMEFLSVMRGSNDNEAINATGLPKVITAGGHVTTKNRRMISNIGCEDGCGLYWQFLRDPQTATISGFTGSWVQFRCMIAGGSSKTATTAIGRYHRDGAQIRGAAKDASLGCRGSSEPRFARSIKG